MRKKTVLNTKKELETPVVRGGGYFDNGNFDIWQRGTSGFTDYDFTADRWFYNLPGTNSNNAYRYETSSINGKTYCLRDDETFDAEGIYGVELYQTLLSSISRHLVGETMTISCYLYLDNATSFTLDLGGLAPSGVDNYTSSDSWIIASNIQTLVNGWNKIEYTFTMPSVSGLSGYSVNNGIMIGFYLHYNSSTASSRDTIWGQMKLELGSIATTFIPKKYHEEMEACRVFYKKSAFGNTLAVGDASTQIAIVIPNFPLMAIAQPDVKILTTTYGHKLSDGTATVTVFSAGDTITSTGSTYFNEHDQIYLYKGTMTGMSDGIYSLNNSATSGNTVSNPAFYEIDAEPFSNR